MKSILRICIFVLLSFLMLSSIQITIKEKSYKNVVNPSVLVNQLPEIINESSGLIFYKKLLWTFNDGGGKPEIYGLDPISGEIKQTIKIKNAINKDWEEITQSNDFIYIGDFGNNFGTRNELNIYRISKKNITSEKFQEVKSDSIAFSYSNYKKERGLLVKSAFDCEAMVFMNDSLCIFTKNWKSANSTLYQIPAKPGEYILYPKTNINAEGFISGASLSFDSKQLALVGYMDYTPFLLLFKLKNGTRIDLSSIERFEMPLLIGAQIEGITYISKDSIIMSSEKNKYKMNSLYLLKL